MTKIFNDERELAKYFMVNTDAREWGEFQQFAYTKEFRYWFRDMWDKYIRGKYVGYAEEHTEWLEVTKFTEDKFVEYIKANGGYVFPVEMHCECVDCGGYWATYETTFTEIPKQLNLFD